MTTLISYIMDAQYIILNIARSSTLHHFFLLVFHATMIWKEFTTSLTPIIRKVLSGLVNSHATENRLNGPFNLLPVNQIC